MTGEADCMLMQRNTRRAQPRHTHRHLEKGVPDSVQEFPGQGDLCGVGTCGFGELRLRPDLNVRIPLHD